MNEEAKRTFCRHFLFRLRSSPFQSKKVIPLYTFSKKFFSKCDTVCHLWKCLLHEIVQAEIKHDGA